MIVGPIIHSWCVALQGATNTVNYCTSSRVVTSEVVRLFGAGPLHHSSTTVLHAVAPSSATQLLYKRSSTVDYISETDMDEVVSSTILKNEWKNPPALVQHRSGLKEVEEASSQPGNLMSWLSDFRMIERAGRITYPHFLQTVDTWGIKTHVVRRVKFIDMLSPVQLNSLTSLFRLVDRDEDGLIDMFDFQAILGTFQVGRVKEGNDSDSQPRLGLSVFKKMTSEEFIGIAAEAELYHLLAETCSKMDSGGNGYVKMDDICCLFHKLKVLCTTTHDESKSIGAKSGSSTVEGEKSPRYIFYKDFIASLLGMKWNSSLLCGETIDVQYFAP